MKKRIRLVSVLLAVSLLLPMASLNASAAELPFDDVPGDAWYYDAVSYAYENGLFNGTTDTAFSPKAPMTRAMFVQVLSNKATNYNKTDYQGKSSFSDVSASKWYAPAIEWASKAGLVSGTGNGKFDPEKNVNREEMALIMYNYAKKTGNDASIDEAAASKYPDFSKVSSWAKEAMQWASKHDVIKGDKAGNINPKNSAQRCEVAQVTVNADPVLVKNEVVVPETPPIDPEPTPDPDDPTPDDLPEGALTYQEFVDMFPNEISRDRYNTVTFLSPYRYNSDEYKSDRSKCQATGIRILRKYAIVRIESILDRYTNVGSNTVLNLTFGYGGWSDLMYDHIELSYFPGKTNHYFLLPGGWD